MDTKVTQKTYKVLWGMTTATYYLVKADSEDQAIERTGYDYDPDEDWAVDSWEDGYVDGSCTYAEVEEVEK